MSITRTKLSFEDKFTQIPNDWLRDTRLSRRARGLLAELMSHSIGWKVTIDSLVQSGPEGRDAIQTAVKELVALGYLTISVRNDPETGRLDGHDYTITEPPTALLENRSTGKPQGGESATKKTISKKINDQASVEAKASTSAVAESPQRPDVEALCRTLSESMITNGVRESKAQVTDGWRNSARLLLDRDKIPMAEAMRVLNWSQRDEFWRKNILSMGTFREKYDRLKMASEQVASGQQQGYRRRPNVQQAMDIVTRLQEEEARNETLGDRPAIEGNVGHGQPSGGRPVDYGLAQIGRTP